MLKRDWGAWDVLVRTGTYYMPVTDTRYYIPFSWFAGFSLSQFCCCNLMYLLFFGNPDDVYLGS